MHPTALHANLSLPPHSANLSAWVRCSLSTVLIASGAATPRRTMHARIIQHGTPGPAAIPIRRTAIIPITPITPTTPTTLIRRIPTTHTTLIRRIATTLTTPTRRTPTTRTTRTTRIILTTLITRTRHTRTIRHRRPRHRRHATPVTSSPTMAARRVTLAPTSRLTSPISRLRAPRATRPRMQDQQAPPNVSRAPPSRAPRRSPHVMPSPAQPSPTRSLRPTPKCAWHAMLTIRAISTSTACRASRHATLLISVRRQR